MNYNSIRKRNINYSGNDKPYNLSRSKIEDFLKCPRCFYLDRKCGTSQPPSFPFTLNNAVDTLLKKEFDKFRIEQALHPLCIKHGIKAIPFSHPDIEDWRMNQRGIQYYHEFTNFCVTGAVDDVWVSTETGDLIIVDYKATSSRETITLEAEYRQSYKRQMEIYQWLFRKNGFRVSPEGYFLYCNGDTEKEDFQGNLEFKITLLPYKGDDSWIDGTLQDILSCLEKTSLPDLSNTCSYCQYWTAVNNHVEMLRS